MKLKNLLIPVIMISLILGLTGAAFAAGLLDLSNHWAKSQIESWVNQGLASGYPDGTFKPDQEISRAEFVALVNRSFNVTKANSTAGFADVKSGDWFFNEVAAAKANGYITGYEDNTFKPNTKISRQEAAAIVVRLLKLDTSGDLVVLDKFKDAKNIPAWSKAGLSAVVKLGIINGYPEDGTVRPFKAITRAEAIVLLKSSLDKQAAKTEPPAEDVTTPGDGSESSNIDNHSGNSGSDSSSENGSSNDGDSNSSVRGVITDASITIEDGGVTHTFKPIGGITDGEKGKIVIEGSANAKVIGGSITVSQNATLTLTAPSMATGKSQELKAGENSLDAFDVLGSFPLGLINSLTKGDGTLKGKLVDKSGHVYNVELLIVIQIKD